MEKMNEFGQVITHNEYNLWLNAAQVLLWPLLIFISYLFIKYTVTKLEAKGYFSDTPEENNTPQNK